MAETATIFGLYGALYHKWTLTMKVLIPVLHCVFTAAQLWGEKCTWDLWQQEKRKAKRTVGVEDQDTMGGGDAKKDQLEAKLMKRTSLVEVTDV